MRCIYQLLTKTTSRKNIQIIALTGLLTALVGCASYHEQTQTQQPNNTPEPEGQNEEIVVTGTRQVDTTPWYRQSRPKKQKKIQSAKKPQISYERSTESTPPVLRESDAQQVFKDYGVNPTISTSNKQFSTFAMDVDTVSYQITKTSLNSGRLPKKSSIRVEEFINNYTYNYKTGDDVFSVSAEITPSPYRPGFHLLHIGVKAKNVDDSARLPANLVLVADVSGSMADEGKMALQKQALTTLVSQLTNKDSVAIVSYSDKAKVVLEPTSAHHKPRIYNAIQQMQIEGSTNAEQGLLKGYDLAEKMAYPGHINRVILTSDGLANIGNTSPKKILKKVKSFREKNIFLTTVGVGKSKYNDYLLEQLANKGNGNYLYLTNQIDIEHVFVDGLTSQLQAVAKDAKIQLKFNPERISLFRQIGYENRGLQTKDFLNADKDGGEVGANQQITALYEIKLTNLDNNDELASVAISYKKPQGSQVFSIKKSIPPSIVQPTYQTASSDTTISMAIAAFAEKLRQSYWSRTYSYQQIQSQLNALPEQLKGSKQLLELLTLLKKAERLDSRDDPYSDRLPLNQINYEQVPLLR